MKHAIQLKSIIRLIIQSVRFLMNFSAGILGNEFRCFPRLCKSIGSGVFVNQQLSLTQRPNCSCRVVSLVHLRLLDNYLDVMVFEWALCDMRQQQQQHLNTVWLWSGVLELELMAFQSVVDRKEQPTQSVTRYQPKTAFMLMRFYFKAHKKRNSN